MEVINSQILDCFQFFFLKKKEIAKTPKILGTVISVIAQLIYLFVCIYVYKKYDC